MLSGLKQDLQKLRNEEKIKVYSNFFKTGKGEYGEGDQFLGISVPEQRKIARKYHDLNLDDIRDLLTSKIHEHRLTALLILVEKHNKSNDKTKQEIFDFYFENAKMVNNWDLVDLTADKIVGAYLIDKDKSILYNLAKSDNIWERRIAIVSTYNFIKNNKLDETFKIAEILMKDKHDLIHKAVGWMLREVGKRDQKEEEKFLVKHYKNMPRTMLRYAIEKFDEEKRKFYLV